MSNQSSTLHIETLELTGELEVLARGYPYQRVTIRQWDNITKRPDTIYIVVTNKLRILRYVYLGEKLLATVDSDGNITMWSSTFPMTFPFVFV